MVVQVENLSELPGAAAALVDFAAPLHFFVFEGEMGAGKTTFIKEFCTCLGVTDLVSSPTFSIVNEYEGAGRPVYHFDFYRIKDETEAYDIGYEEYFYGGGICLVEWPEKIPGLLPQQFVRVRLEITGPASRQITFQKIL